ncbi:MAG: hypothetical protein QXN95_03790 [Candidatus Bathyarchaeia archaeon]
MNLHKSIRKVFPMLISAFLMLGMIPLFTPQTSAQDGTKIVVLPINNTFYANTTKPGDTFIVNVTVVDVEDLQNWQIKLTWDPTLLEYSSIYLPRDHVFAPIDSAIQPPGTPGARSMITPPPDVGPGYVMWGCTYINDPYWTFNGTGVLCQVKLKILTPPSFPATCNLTLAEIGYSTFLLNGPGYDILFTVEDATYTYIDDLTVSISPLGTYTSPIKVNYGETKTFTATALYGALPYTHQWFFQWPNGTEIEVTEAFNQTSWECYPITVAGLHKVTVQVTDYVGVSKNASSYLKLAELSLQLMPATVIINVGGSKTFTATISGGVPPYKIQWFRNDIEETAYENQTSATFTFSTEGVEYVKVKVTDSAGTTLEKTATVRVVTPTAIIRVTAANGVTTYYSNMTKVGDEITFNVTVVDVEDLQNWQIHLTWDPTLLNFTEISLPSDHVFAGANRAMITPSLDVGPGYVSWGCTYINDPYWTFNGTGVLCQVKLKIIRQPLSPQSTCTVGLVNPYEDTFILNAAENDIPFTIENATYTYKLVSPVAHQLLGFTILTHTNTSIIANAINHNIAGAWIEFLQVTGAPGTSAYINITLPKNLIWDSWKVYIDGVEVTPQITSDNTNTYIYVEFVFEDYDAVVKVQGSGMVSEQIHLLLMALLMASLIIAATKTFPKKKVFKTSKI